MPPQGSDDPSSPPTSGDGAAAREESPAKGKAETAVSSPSASADAADAAPSASAATLTDAESSSAISSFVKFLRYETVSATAPSTGAYVECSAFLLDLLKSVPSLDEIRCLEEAPDHSPVVTARWRGKDDSLPVLLLNSHYDVVPAERKKEDEGGGWTVEPFEGWRNDGKIYGRGTQDMKCVCIQYIEAIRKLHSLRPNFTPERSIYLTFVPDEEVGGSGMAAFLSSSLYKSLPGIALALDEGLASETDTYSVFYGERLPWWVDVKATGPTGHGSRFIDNTAVEQLVELANKALAFRKGQRDALHGSSAEADHSNCSHAVAAKRRRLAKDKAGSRMALGDVTSLNITTIEAGVKAGNGDFVYNCVPPSAKLSMDIRISPHMDPNDMGELLDGWCRECSADSSPDAKHKLSWSYIGSEQGNVTANDLRTHSLTSTDPKINPWYSTFASAMSSMDRPIAPEVFPAATDSRFLRALGIRALGFSPMRHSDILLHEDDECIEESVFLDGIGVYVGLIEALGSVGGEVDEVTAEGEKGGA